MCPQEHFNGVCMCVQPEISCQVVRYLYLAQTNIETGLSRTVQLWNGVYWWGLNYKAATVAVMWSQRSSEFKCRPLSDLWTLCSPGTTVSSVHDLFFAEGTSWLTVLMSPFSFPNYCPLSLGDYGCEIFIFNTWRSLGFGLATFSTVIL